MMLHCWSLRDSKSSQVSRILLRILADLINAVVWMISTRSLISKSSSPFNNPLVTVPRAPITIGINVTFMFHIFFNSLARSRYLYFFSLSFNFTLWSAGTAKSTILQVPFFFCLVVVEYYKVWLSGGDLLILLYIKIPLEFVSHIPQDKCWVVHIPFVRMVKISISCTILSGSPCPLSRV